MRTLASTLPVGLLLLLLLAVPASAWEIRSCGGSNKLWPIPIVNVRTRGVLEEAEAIREVPVGGAMDGMVLRVRDIATVREDFVDQQISLFLINRRIADDQVQW